MIQKIYTSFLSAKNEIASLDAKNRFFILYALICSFLICMEYSIIRPVSNSLFIHAYSANWFPYAWLATVPLNLLLVSLYNHFLGKWGCFKMCTVIVSFICFGHLFCALFFQKISSLPFLFYVWKEIYILLLFQQLWSVVHSSMKLNHAKYLYGFLFGIGGLGSFCGSLIPGFFAQTFGSESLLYFSIPLYLLLLFFYYRLVQKSEVAKIKEDLPGFATGALRHGIKLIANSKSLTFILLLVFMMHTTCSIIDFQFNHHLESLITDKDLRTEYLGKVLSIVHFATIILQFFGSFLLLQLLGLKKSHLTIPIVLMASSIGSFAFPVAAMFSLSFIAVKSFDFSLFGIVKEMLYVPLKVDEKFRAKAVIDVLAYRTSKSIASFFILLLQFFAISNINATLSLMNICLFSCWVLLVLVMFKAPELKVAD